MPLVRVKRRNPRTVTSTTRPRLPSRRTGTYAIISGGAVVATVRDAPNEKAALANARRKLGSRKRLKAVKLNPSSDQKTLQTISDRLDAISTELSDLSMEVQSYATDYEEYCDQ